ncbi:hypothetical protein [Alkalihalobacillus sp. 1P02AB]|uniref:hypothetical protein n=1 Tax=Alkalihalobacillus sp. 1P02AB TaxID=3132260 RepID=UPI0039A5AA92
MSKKKHEPVKRDLFSDLMFGRPPEPEPEKKSSFFHTVEQLIVLVDKIGPALDKFVPIILIAQALLEDKASEKEEKKEKE